MSNPRKILLQNDNVYHICNRAIEGMTIFKSQRDYERALMLLRFYRYDSLPMRLSHLLQLSPAIQDEVLRSLIAKQRLVDILAFAIMPNHFHLLLRQNMEDGISKFVSNISNGFARYFNTKYKRVGPIFQGSFRAVFIENDEQLMHVSRYIHLNPVASSILRFEDLRLSRWNSFSEYLNLNRSNLVDTELIMSLFKDTASYEEFVKDHVGYSKELHIIKHLLME